MKRKTTTRDNSSILFINSVEKLWSARNVFLWSPGELESLQRLLQHIKN